MIDILHETFAHNERESNRACARVALWVGHLMLMLCVSAFLFLDRNRFFWLWINLGCAVLPSLLVAGYARYRRFTGAELKYMMVGVSALYPLVMCMYTALGYYLIPLPLLVAARYCSRRLVWLAFVFLLVAIFLVSIVHAQWGTPCLAMTDSTHDLVAGFVAGNFDRAAYLRVVEFEIMPVFAFLTLFFTITLHSICRAEGGLLRHHAEVVTRLADAEKGLAIAAAQSFMMQGLSQLQGQKAVFTSSMPSSAKNQPDVKGWSATAISDCIAACKKRAAGDEKFAKLLETNPAAAVKEVMGRG